MANLFPSQGRPTTIIADPAKVEAILQQHLGFSTGNCLNALEAGHARGALATAHSAVGQFGSDFYFGIIEQLRSELGQRGYDPKVIRGLELARRRSNLMQVTACMATDGAGDVGGHPNPKNPKGSSSKKAIHDNQGTLGILAPHESWEQIETWWMLYQVHGDAPGRSINAELSLPNRMTSPRDFGWSIRLILPTIDLATDSATPALPQPAADVQVPIVRRVG